MNDLGCEHFAKEHGQKLTHFYSIDRIHSQNLERIKQKSKGIYLDPQRSSNKIGDNLQNIL